MAAALLWRKHIFSYVILVFIFFVAFVIVSYLYFFINKASKSIPQNVDNKQGKKSLAA